MHRSMKWTTLTFISILSISCILFSADKHSGEWIYDGLPEKSWTPKLDAIAQQFNFYRKKGLWDEPNEPSESIVNQRLDRLFSDFKFLSQRSKKISFSMKKKKRSYLVGYQEVHLSFDSAYDLKDFGTHPRKTGFAKIFYSPHFGGPANYIIFPPHINDDLTPLETLAKTLVGLSKGQIAVVVLTPPLYGRRGLAKDKFLIENNGEPYLTPRFITPNYEKTYHNMLQTVLIFTPFISF